MKNWKEEWGLQSVLLYNALIKILYTRLKDNDNTSCLIRCPMAKWIQGLRVINISKYMHMKSTVGKSLSGPGHHGPHPSPLPGGKACSLHQVVAIVFTSSSTETPAAPAVIPPWLFSDCHLVVHIERCTTQYNHLRNWQYDIPRAVRASLPVHRLVAAAPASKPVLYSDWSRNWNKQKTGKSLSQARKER